MLKRFKHLSGMAERRRLMILNAHSNYSLRYGTLSIEDVIEDAVANQYDSIALTDINNTTGIIPFVRQCREKGLNPIAGAEFRKGDELLFIAIARNNAGFKEINDLLTDCHLEGRPYPERHEFSHCYVIYPYGKKLSWDLRENEFIGIRFRHLNKIRFEKSVDQKKYIFLLSSTYKTRPGYDLHKKLRAVDHNILLSQLQSQNMAGNDEYIIPREKLLGYLADFPYIVTNTVKITYSCSIDFDFETVKNKKHFTGSHYEDKLLLERIAVHGFTQRYGVKRREVLKRLHHELEIIDRQGFSGYFLITWDMVQFTWGKGYYHVGRGSGANSVVAYCLRITDVCPIELDLYFERFLNPKRNSPPDFDIDYSWTDRDYVYDYLFERYGKKHTALLGAMVTFQPRSIIREMGKVYGLPKEDIDRIIDYPDSHLNNNGLCKQVLSHFKAIADFPSNRSIHSGGVLISEEPLSCYMALDLPPKGYATAQIDMHIAEEIRYEKLDVLSQRGLGHIKEAAEIIQVNRGLAVDVHQVEKFKKDKKCNALLESGQTIGCFYIESPAMRSLLEKLRCKDYPTLVAASSVIRPGVSKSGMMKAYIERILDPTCFTYLHPLFEEHLSETKGVMVYQEDVLRVAHHFGGLDLADADVLRRMMSGKKRDARKLKDIERKYYEFCRTQKYKEGLAEEIWRQIESFAGYSFAKGHSASYAVESYQDLFLKSYFPLEFMVAVINNFGGYYQTRVYVDEARKLGATVHLPCVNKSQHKTCIYGTDVYLGFVHVKSLEKNLAAAIPAEHDRNGDFTSLENFKLRTRCSLEQLIILIRVGALRFTGHEKPELLWEAHMLYNAHDKKNKHQAGALFEEPSVTWNLPKLIRNQVHDLYDELEILEFPVSASSFDLVKSKFRGDCLAKDLPQHIGNTVRLVGNFVDYKLLPTSKGEPMAFGCFLDVNGDFFNTNNFPKALKAWPFRGGGVYMIQGQVTEEFGVPSINVIKMAPMPIQGDDRAG